MSDQPARRLRHRLLPLVALTLCAPLAVAAVGLEDYEFRDQDVRDILATIAAEEDLNLVYAPGLLTDIDDQPIRVSAKLEDVSPRDAVIAVVQAAGLRFEERGNGILVVQPSLERIWADLRRRHHRDHGGREIELE